MSAGGKNELTDIGGVTALFVRRPVLAVVMSLLIVVAGSGGDRRGGDT